MAKSDSSQDGISFLSLLTLLFVGLKLGGAIAWPWLWVLAPMWLPLAIMLAAGLVFVFVAGIADHVSRQSPPR